MLEQSSRNSINMWNKLKTCAAHSLIPFLVSLIVFSAAMPRFGSYLAVLCTAEWSCIFLYRKKDKYIMEAVTYEHKKKRGWLKWVAVAACLSTVVVYFAFPLLNRTPSSSAHRPVTAYIPEDVSSLTAIYTAEGSTVIRLIEGTELDQLRTWTNDLLYRYILIADSGKEPPYNTKIREMYEFIITEGSYPGYSYICTESGDSYLLIEM